MTGGEGRTTPRAIEVEGEQAAGVADVVAAEGQEQDCIMEANERLMAEGGGIGTGGGGSPPSKKQIDASKDRFPYCIVWTPLPLISWILPFVGHVGIATANGVIYDFAGPYFVSVDNMAFGRPTKYWQLDPIKTVSDWDSAVVSGSEEYRKHMHNLLCDNCHSHVGLCLNNMAYGGKRNWTMLSVVLQLTLHSKYVSFGRFMVTYLPFCVIAAVVTLLVVFLG